MIVRRRRMLAVPHHFRNGTNVLWIMREVLAILPTMIEARDRAQASRRRRRIPPSIPRKARALLAKMEGSAMAEDEKGHKEEPCAD